MSEDKITVKIGKDKTEFLKNGVPFGRYRTVSSVTYEQLCAIRGKKWKK